MPAGRLCRGAGQLVLVALALAVALSVSWPRLVSYRVKRLGEHHTTTPIADSAAAAPSRYLVVRSIRFGRFSNNVIALQEAMALAASSGRILVVPSFDRCLPDEPLEAIFDAIPGLIVLGASNTSLTALCGDPGAAPLPYLPLRDEVAGARNLTWLGVAWRVVDPADLYPVVPARDVFSPADAKFASVKNASSADVYARYFAPGVAMHGLPELLVDHFLHVRLALSPEPCVLIGNPFLSLNWAVLPSPVESLAVVTRALRPSRRILAAAASWLAGNNASWHDVGASLGIHLRGKDIGNFDSLCRSRPQSFVDDLRAFAARQAPFVINGGAGRPSTILVASDDARSPCLPLVAAAFPGARILGLGGEGPAGLRRGGCGEAWLIQSVMGRTAAFVGNGYSTFSGLCHQLRMFLPGAGAIGDVASTLFLM